MRYLFLTLLVACGAPVTEHCACYYQDGFCCPRETPFLCLYEDGKQTLAFVSNSEPVCVAESTDCPGSSARCGYDAD